jgi:hypothetical protein
VPICGGGSVEALREDRASDDQYEEADCQAKSDGAKARRRL